MDTIYSNKKYLQNLNAADYYRTNTMRPTNEYASYHNTMSRRSLFGSHYSHQQPNISKYKYSYPSDVSLSSHYGYTSWGLWRDGHLSPSVYSKKRINIRSFSILIMSAAFIVLLAVLSVAGLAFYFSTFKSDPSESMLVFDCGFRIAKGDKWTSQLKYNHTPMFRQRAAFYTKFIETSLEHGNFNVAKTDINSFGNGPELLLNFRIYLDMRKIQMTISNVEEHIKNALISETAHTDSTFRNMKIDIDSVEIKRQLDPEVLQKAAFIYEQSQDVLTTVIPLDDLKKTAQMTTEKPKFKPSIAATTSPSTLKSGSKMKPTQKPIQESDIDMDNLPVIQGSFEITKTDADITQKRSSIAARPASTASLIPNTLKPFHISPASSIKVKSSGQQQQQHSSSTSPTTVMTMTTTAKTENIVEMFLQHQKNLQQKIIKESPVTAKIEKTNKSGETMTTTTMSTVASTEESSTVIPLGHGESQINKDLPKLDVSLFTSAPILDQEPWRPINPSPEQIKTNLPVSPSSSSSSSSSTVLTSPITTTEANPGSSSSIATEMPVYRSPFNPQPSVNVMYRNKFVDPDTAHPVNDNSDESVLYQSFYNPDFSAGSLEIEKLGIADVRPYPLPVNKIDVSEESTVPEFRPMEIANDNKKIIIDATNYDESKFEHLGGGVIAKKQDVTGSNNDNNSTVAATTTTTTTTTTMTTTTPMKINVAANVNDSDTRDAVDDTDTATSLDDIFQELLLDNNDMMYNETNANRDVLESRIVPDNDDDNDDDDDDDEDEILTTTQKLNFMNMKDFIMQLQQNKSDNLQENSTMMQSSSSSEIISTTTMITTTPTTIAAEKPTASSTFIEVNTVKYTPSVTSTISEPQLFPSISKWEFVNGTRANNTELSVTKKVFNETLQAVIVENAQAPSHAAHLDELKANKTVDKGNLQQLSSIFDTLAAKLGIKPDVSSKIPPFSQHTQNKLKQSGSNQVRASTRKNTSTTLPIKQRVTTTTTKTKTTTPRATKTTKKSTAATPTTVKTTTVRSEPTRGFELSSESFFGQAEGIVEAVDPTQYEEILSMASSPLSKFISTTPSLVTLMPVKSNSGIRNFNPRLRLASSSSQLSSSGETRNMEETVVKTSMTFDS